MELNLAEISDLQRGENGIWRLGDRGKVDGVSYPDEGNRDCLGIEESSFWFSHRNRCIAATVGNFPPQGAIFDIGGGNGLVARGLVEAGFPVIEPVGTEPTEAEAAAMDAHGNFVGRRIGAFYSDFFGVVNVVSLVLQLFLVSRIVSSSCAAVSLSAVCWSSSSIECSIGARRRRTNARARSRSTVSKGLFGTRA